jgi:hypothetical protein
MSIIKILISSFIAGFIAEGFMGAAFSGGPARSILYDPDIQSRLFIEITPTRNLAYSIFGLLVWSSFHGFVFKRFLPLIPGSNQIQKGIFFGIGIWFFYWLPQEWFMFHTLIREPILLCLLELCILIIGSIIQGVILALFIKEK